MAEATAPGGAEKLVEEGVIPAALVRGQAPPHLGDAPPEARVTKVRHCGNSFLITTEGGTATAHWEREVRIKIDSAETGSPEGVPVVLGTGMRGDRISLIFGGIAEMHGSSRKPAEIVPRPLWTAPGPVTTLARMKPVLRLVLILLFALVAATGGMVPSDASAEPVSAAAADQPMMAMSGGDCDACAPERMDAGMAGCGSVCAGAQVAIGATQLPCPSSESSAQFRSDDWFHSGRARQPEPTPPKHFLS